jgi:hypothetical protein
VTSSLAVRFVIVRLLAVGCWLLAVGLQNNSRGDKMTESVVVLQGVSW